MSGDVLNGYSARLPHHRPSVQQLRYLLITRTDANDELYSDSIKKKASDNPSDNPITQSHYGDKKNLKEQSDLLKFCISLPSFWVFVWKFGVSLREINTRGVFSVEATPASLLWKGGVL